MEAKMTLRDLERKSNKEEIIGLLWWIVAGQCFILNNNILGWICFTKGLIDMFISIVYGWRYYKQEELAQTEQSFLHD
jgi:hypothetical protein